MRPNWDENDEEDTQKALKKHQARESQNGFKYLMASTKWGGESGKIERHF